MSYPVGTLCLITGATRDFQNVGKECTTVSPLFQNEEGAVNQEGINLLGSGYLVEIKGDMSGLPWYVQQNHLIKIDPDPEQDFTGEDEECPLDKRREKVLVER